MPQSVWIGSSGCLLPFLIIFNLFFGRLIFDSTRLWLGIEAILILLFILKINIMAKRIFQQSPGFTSDSQRHRSKDRIIDIKGQVIEDEKKLK